MLIGCLGFGKRYGADCLAALPVGPRATQKAKSVKPSLEMRILSS